MKPTSQKNLAKQLGLTDRRVRQLVEEKILPEPDEADGYDLEKCRARYDLYAHGDDVSWADFDRQMLEDAHQLEELMAKALKPKARQKDLAACAHY